jgi:16S rRNA (cytidine1402-2'-O)-methyltransferase
MPSVSDPGFVLVRAAVEAGVAVTVLPGPSAPLVAVVVSGLPVERWRFVGFLPRKAGELRAVLAATPETLVAFESPRRVGATLEVLTAVDAARPVAVCRELTKVHEEVLRGTAAEVLERVRAVEPRGEVVLVVGAADAAAAAQDDAVAALRRLVDAGREAAARGGRRRRPDRRAGERALPGAPGGLRAACRTGGSRSSSWCWPS